MIRKFTQVVNYNRGFELSNGYKIYFDVGNFDEWCVYIEDINGNAKRPTDIDYFQELYCLKQQYGSQYVYDSFCLIYDVVTENWDLEAKRQCVDICRKVAQNYTEDTLLLWLTFFMTMVAEENKKNMILKKRIKRLAVHKILLLDEPIDVVAKSMDGVGWRTLDAEMQKYGF